MKKIIVLMTSLILLTGCVKVSFTGPKKEEKTSQSTSSKKEPLTFVRADQYKDQDNEVLEASEKFIKDIQRLEKLENYLSFSQAIPLEMRKIASPCSLS